MKSFSMAMGIRRPGFQLLSFVSVVPSEASLTQIPVPPPLDTPCFLPDQLGIYLYVYLRLILLSLVVLFVSNISWSRQQELDTRCKRQKHQDGTYESPHHSQHGSNRRSADDYYDDGYSSSLPPPATKPRYGSHTSTRPRGRSWSPTSWTWAFKFGNQRRRITLPLFLSRARNHPRDQRIHELGMLRAFGQDVLNVAVPPLCVFLLGAWWSMHQ